MSKIDVQVLGLGISCLIGGVLLAYFGYFAPPYLLLTIGMPVSIAVLFAPFLLVFLGAIMIWVSLVGKSAPKKKKIKEAQSPPPPPPPTAVARTCPICGQPLAFMQQYGRWYCANCKKYP